MHRPARILHVGPAPPVPTGGISAYVLGVFASSLATRYRLGVVDTMVPAVLQRRRALRGLRPGLAAWFAIRLAAALVRRRPDLVHVHTSDFESFWEKTTLARLARAAGCPVLLHLHGPFDAFAVGLGPHRAAWARRALEAATRVVVLSEAARPIVAAAAPTARVVVLPNAIDAAAFAPPPVGATPRREPTVRLLFVGGLNPNKGLDDLLAALVTLAALDWRLDIVGGDELAGEHVRLESVLRTLGLEPRVRLHGPLYGADKLQHLHAADVFLLPSRHESFGIANLEAMAAGLPVISTRTGAIPEYIESGVHGLLVPPGDVAALAGAVRALVADPALRRQLGAAARQRAADYDWSRVAMQIAAVYDTVLAEVSAAKR